MRFNPYSEALSNRLRGMHGVLKQTPPPPQVRSVIEEYDRRVADPQGSLPEWQAVYETQGPEGIADYLEGVSRLKEAWGL